MSQANIGPFPFEPLKFQIHSLGYTEIQNIHECLLSSQLWICVENDDQEEMLIEDFDEDPFFGEEDFGEF